MANLKTGLYRGVHGLAVFLGISVAWYYPHSWRKHRNGCDRAEERERRWYRF